MPPPAITTRSPVWLFDAELVIMSPPVDLCVCLQFYGWQAGKIIGRGYRDWPSGLLSLGLPAVADMGN
jgi:hypothetical protein